MNEEEELYEFPEEEEEEDLQDFDANGRYYVMSYLQKYIDIHPTHEKLKKIEEDYRYGTKEEREEALNRMYGILCSYIWSYIKKYYSSYILQHGEDLFQAALLGVMEGMDGYDADRGKPTTWFKNPIRHQIVIYTSEYLEHSSSHFTTTERQVKELARQKEAAGIPYTVRDLYIETGIPIKTIQNALSAGNVAVSSFSATSDNDGIFASGMMNPERAAVDESGDMRIYNAVYGGSLSQDEIFVIVHLNGLFNTEELKPEEIREKIGITNQELEVLEASAIEKIKQALSGHPSGDQKKKKKEKPKRAKSRLLSKEELREEEELIL